tara:strand:+ start:980 stop:1204 length:225 start_codon:yes stop_codon:yes gene_type:complete
MIGDDEIKEMQDHITEMERELAIKKKAVREAKYAGLRAAMQARKEADEAVKQELKDLGIASTPFGTPFDFHWKF